MLLSHAHHYKNVLQRKTSLKAKARSDYAEFQEPSVNAAAQAFSLLTEDYSSESDNSAGSDDEIPEEFRDSTAVFLPEDADETNLVLL